MNGSTGEAPSNQSAKNATPIPSKKSNSTPPRPNEHDVVTRVLQFLSTAKPETLGGVAVGLAACTYLILGRIGLVLIGTVGGVVLHATWEAHNHAAGSIESIRREQGIDIVRRVLDLRATRSKVQEDEVTTEGIENSFEGFPPETAAALNELIDAVIRDYVKWWYGPILPKELAFPAASRQTLTKFVLSVSYHLSRKRPADSFLDFLTNSSSIVIVFLNELSSALSTSPGANVTAAESVYAYLSTNPESNLANILNQKQQSKKFKMIAEDILQNFLEKSTYDCDPARIFLREVLGSLILEMTLKTCSKPEWINGWIVYLLEQGEPDISQAIDAGMDNDDDDMFSSPFNDFDGNMGNIRLARPSRRKSQKEESKKHQRRLSKAEEAMEEALEEAKRLSKMIAEEDAIKAQSPQLEVVQNPLGDAPPALVKAVERTAKSLDLNTNGLIHPDIVAATPKGVTSITSTPLETVSEQHLPSAEPSPVKSSAASQELNSEKTSIHNSEASPISPLSSISPKTVESKTSFTSFDQIVPQSIPVALQAGSPMPRRKTTSLTLINANIIIYDDSEVVEKGKLRSKPNADYLVQIEPASSDHPGWMIVRRYPDFETLHEVLRRIAQISGVPAFLLQHRTLPNWKEHNKASLRVELEKYLRNACSHQPLAESEGMKRFLEKDQGQVAMGSKEKSGFAGLGWPTPSAFENMGKGMLDVLASAPKGVAEGGKAIGGGITGVFSNIGNLGQKKGANGTANGTHTADRASTSILPRMESTNSIATSRASRASEDSLRVSPIVHTQPSKVAPMERRPSYHSIAESENEREPRASSARSSLSGRRSATYSREPSRAPSRAPSRKGTPLNSPTQLSLNEMKLPPGPADMPDDYGSHTDDSKVHSRAQSLAPTSRTSTSTAPSQKSPGRTSMSATRRPSVPVLSGTRKPRETTPLTEQETRQAVELMFAVINEMYTLSSAWNIRRTLLNAAKTFLLRPGNPSLSSIQSLIQDSVIASNTSDSGIAFHLRKIRENGLPTEEELKAWPAELTMEEKERLRIKARKLLVERGVPAALTGVMGQAATGEAMGRIFDCLQIEEVARGLIFGLLLQGVRAITH